MECIKADLSRSLDAIEIHTFADLHIGDKHSDGKLIQQRINYVKDTDNAYCILNGDICNWALRNSKSDPYAEVLKPMEQIQMFADLFSPIKEKLLAITPGNHESRSYTSDGIDVTQIACQQIGVSNRYSNTSALVFVRFGAIAKKESTGTGEDRKVCYTIYTVHGGGGGRKEGSNANRLADMACIVDADIYIHSHTHLPMIMKEAFFRTDLRNSAVAVVDKLFVNTGASMTYGGYAEIQEYKPASKATPVIYLSGKSKDFTARL